MAEPVLTTPVTHKPARQGEAVILLVILCLVWGSSFILIKRGLVSLEPQHVGALRTFTAWVVMLPFAVTQFRKVQLRHWKYLATSGLLGIFLPSLLFSVAGSKLSSAVSGALNALTPFLTTLVAAVFFRVRITGLKWAGLALGLSGALLLALTGRLDAFRLDGYAGFVFIACLFYGINMNVTKRYLDSLESPTIASMTVFMAGLPAGVVLFYDGTFLAKLSDAAAWQLSIPSVMLLGAFGTAVAQFLFNRLIKITSAVYASTVTYLMPCIALLWGIWDGEPIALHHVAGLLLILAGIVLVNRQWK